MRTFGIKKAKFLSTIFKQLLQQKELMKKTDMFSIHLLLPGLLSLTAAIFEAISLGLLIPVVKGIIEMNFGFVREMPVLKNIIEMFPQLFTTPNSSLFILLIVIILTATIAKSLILYCSALSIDYQYRKFINNLRKIMLDRILSFGKLFFDRQNSGHLSNVVMWFTQETAGRIIHIHLMIKWFFVAIVYFGIMWIISWKLTVFVMTIPPILYYSSGWLVEKIKKTSKYAADSRDALSARIYNVLSCIPLVMLYMSERQEKEKFSYESDQVAGFEFSMDKKERLIEPLQELVMLTIIILLMSLMAFLIIRDKTGEIAGFFIYFYLMRRIAMAIDQLMRERAGIARSRGALDEILNILDDRDKYFIPDGKKELVSFKELIEFKKLNFSYIPEVQVLKDVTFSIRKGEMTAIVGPTGSGKTTLISLLLRFYDCPPSSILIDGEDIREFTLKSLRAHMSLVSQETLLFNDTLRANIAYGIDSVNDELLIDIAKKARLYDFIMKLPDGLNTFIGDRGVKLSGGEKQRVAIARALLKGSEIIILDEATSSLDSLTEKLIQEAIEEAVKDRTAIVIAHRLSTIRNADKIVVIEDGRLIEQGTLNELLEKKDRFYAYWNEQVFF